MLAGINLQPGAWDKTTGDLDDVLISDITMQSVSTPFHFLLKPGNTANRITVTRVTATGVYRAACSVESWAEAPFKNVTFRDVDIEFEGGGIAGKIPAQVKALGVDARSLPAWGFYARNVENLTLEDFRLACLKPDRRSAVICDDVNQLTLDTFRFTRCKDVNEPVVLNRVGNVRLSNTDIPSVRK